MVQLAMRLAKTRTLKRVGFGTEAGHFQKALPLRSATGSGDRHHTKVAADEATQQLADRVARRRQIVDMIVAERQRGSVRQSLTKMKRRHAHWGALVILLSTSRRQSSVPAHGRK